MLEREVKLAAPPAFSLPDLEDVAAAVETSPVDERRLETVYYDTPDLRLARWGANLRIRQGEGWTLKLPSTSEGPALTRRELEFPGDAGRPPDAAVALVIAYVRRASLVPVASLSTLRRRIQLKTRDGALLAEVVDDDVSVIQGLRVQNRFREVEVAARPHPRPPSRRRGSGRRSDVQAGTGARRARDRRTGSGPSGADPSVDRRRGGAPRHRRVGRELDAPRPRGAAGR